MQSDDEAGLFNTSSLRRGVLRGALAALSLAGAFSSSAHARQTPARRTGRRAVPAREKKFVLVHGAFAGGWVWKMTAAALRARGHSVWTPTLSGVGERSHLAGFDINLTTHVEDVLNVIKWEDLERGGICLVGHSYGGMVISGVAERASAGTIDSFVIIDGAVPQDGQSLYSYFGRPMDNLPRIRPVGEGPGAELPEETRAWMAGKLTPQPMATFTEPVRLTGAREAIRTKTFIKATGPGTVTFPHQSVERIRADPTWRYEELACGHNTPVEAPEETAAALERAALA